VLGSQVTDLDKHEAGEGVRTPRREMIRFSIKKRWCHCDEEAGDKND
jgi:hypothetical protein